MSGIYDLTNNKIKDTYNRLLQITSSDNIIRDGVGNPITTASLDGGLLIVGSIQATSPVAVTSSNSITASYAETASYTDSVKWLQTGSKIYTKDTNSHVSINNFLEITGSINSDITQMRPPHQEGKLFWDSGSHTYVIYNDQPDVTLQIGQENYVRVSAGEYIPNGSPVYISGSNSILPIVKLGLACLNIKPKCNVIGLATHDIESGSSGYITIDGIVHDVDTSTFNAGDNLYLSPYDSGTLINSVPLHPYSEILCGTVILNDVSGSILVDFDRFSDIVNTSVGVVDSPYLTELGSGSFIIGTGSVNLNESIDGKGRILNFPMTAALFTLTSSFLDAQYVYASYNSGSPIYELTSEKSSVKDIQKALVYTITSVTNNALSYVSWDTQGTLLSNKLHDRIVHTDGIKRENGLILSESGSRYVTVTGGDVWQGIHKFTLPAFNSGTGDRLILLVASASVFSGSIITQYNSTDYNGPGGLVPLTGTQWNVNWVYRGVGNLNATIIMLSDDKYSTIANAIEAKPPTTPSEMGDIAILLGRVIYRRNDTVARQIDTAFVQTFVAAGITSHNNLNGLQGGTTDEYYHLSSSDYNYATRLASTKTIKYLEHNMRVLTSSYSASGNYDVFFVSGSGNINLYLYNTNLYPSSSLKIKLLSNLNLSIYPTGGQLIEFDPTASLTTKGQSMTIWPFSGSWYKI